MSWRGWPGGRLSPHWLRSRLLGCTLATCLQKGRPLHQQEPPFFPPSSPSSSFCHPQIPLPFLLETDLLWGPLLQLFAFHRTNSTVIRQDWGRPAGRPGVAFGLGSGREKDEEGNHFQPHFSSKSPGAPPICSRLSSSPPAADCWDECGGRVCPASQHPLAPTFGMLLLFSSECRWGRGCRLLTLTYLHGTNTQKNFKRTRCQLQEKRQVDGL